MYLCLWTKCQFWLWKKLTGQILIYHAKIPPKRHVVWINFMGAHYSFVDICPISFPLKAILHVDTFQKSTLLLDFSSYMPRTNKPLSSSPDLHVVYTDLVKGVPCVYQRSARDSLRVNCLTHYPLVDLAVILKALAVKVLSGECPRTSLIRSQHWSGNGLVPSGNKPFSDPMLTKSSVAIWHH